jgi:hypothetical protein
MVIFIPFSAGRTIGGGGAVVGRRYRPASTDRKHKGDRRMNPGLNCIFFRRSVREYLDKEIPAALLADLFEARTRCRSACLHRERRR